RSGPASSAPSGRPDTLARCGAEHLRRGARLLRRRSRAVAFFAVANERSEGATRPGSERPRAGYPGSQRATERSGNDEHAELGFELRARLGSERGALEPAVAEEADERDALHVVLLRERWLLVDVDLHDLVGTLAHRRDLL